MVVGNANSICNIMRANECFTPGQSIQQTYTPYIIHETPDTCTIAHAQPKKMESCRMRCVTDSAYMCTLSRYDSFPTDALKYFKCKWTYMRRRQKNESLWVTGNIIPCLISQCAQSSFLDWECRSCTPDFARRHPCLSLRGDLCITNLNKKDRWGEGQLTFINHSCSQPERTKRN